MSATTDTDDGGVVATCDLCGSSSDHSHADEEYGRPEPDDEAELDPWADEGGSILILLQWEANNLRDAQLERDRLIRKARSDGESIAAIAEAAHLTGPGVRRILARSEPE